MNTIRMLSIRLVLSCFVAAVALISPLAAAAHDLPYSYIELRADDKGLAARVEITNIDSAHELGTVAPEDLIFPESLSRCSAALSSIVLQRLTIYSGNTALPGRLTDAVVVPQKQNVALTFRFDKVGISGYVTVDGQLFPYDPRHKSFLSVYNHGRLVQQTVLQPGAYSRRVSLEQIQTIPSVIKQFVKEGVHHIYLGPDHILFILGLVLLPATLGRLLKITTAFTIAHSLTLAVATLGLLNPSAKIIEPTIALSIVVVGVHALLKERRDQQKLTDEGIVPDSTRNTALKWFSDPRLVFAFGFGLIHGFGFASALREMALPRYALGWSLLSFNVGVEIGQACIVLAAAPLLAMLRQRQPNYAFRVVMAGSIVVIVAGAFWFVQRVSA